MVTFSAFYDAIKAIARPESVAENLETHFRTAVCNALIEVQTYAPQYRSYNTTFYCAMDLRDFCGAQLFNGPRGVIQDVFAFKPGTDCQKFHFDRKSTNYIDCWIDQQRCVTCATTDTDAGSTHIYTSPYCNYPIPSDEACGVPYLTEGETDADCAFKNGDRFFAVGPDYRIILAPRLPCGYLIGVSWEGINRCWRNTDGVMEDEDLKQAVALYAEAQGDLKDRDLASYNQLMTSWRLALKGIVHRGRRERRLTAPRDCSSPLVDSLLPFINPLVIEGRPYDAVTCNAGTDTDAPSLNCYAGTGV